MEPLWLPFPSTLLLTLVERLSALLANRLRPLTLAEGLPTAGFASLSAELDAEPEKRVPDIEGVELADELCARRSPSRPI